MLLYTTEERGQLVLHSAVREQFQILNKLAYSTFHSWNTYSDQALVWVSQKYPPC